MLVMLLVMVVMIGKAKMDYSFLKSYCAAQKKNSLDRTIQPEFQDLLGFLVATKQVCPSDGRSVYIHVCHAFGFRPSMTYGRVSGLVFLSICFMIMIYDYTAQVDSRCVSTFFVFFFSFFSLYSSVLPVQITRNPRFLFLALL